MTFLCHVTFLTFRVVVRQIPFSLPMTAFYRRFLAHASHTFASYTPLIAYSMDFPALGLRSPELPHSLSNPDSRLRVRLCKGQRWGLLYLRLAAVRAKPQQIVHIQFVASISFLRDVPQNYSNTLKSFVLHVSATKADTSQFGKDRLTTGPETCNQARARGSLENLRQRFARGCRHS